MADFTMPTLGADMDRGTLLEWRVDVGDTVTAGDIIAVIDTEKSTVEIEVFETGVVQELLVQPGTEVPVGTPLARIGAESIPPVEAPPTDPPLTDPPLTVPPPVVAPPVATFAVDPAVPERPAVPEHSVVSSPLVRHLADELGIDTNTIMGTGVGHRITRDDVEQAARSRREPGSSPLARRRARELGVDVSTVAGSGPGGAVRARDLSTDGGGEVPAPAALPTAAQTTDRQTTDRRTTMRSAIARVMTISNREIPHYHLTLTIDLHDALDLLAGHNTQRPPGERVLPAALLLRATAMAAAKHPQLNGCWIDDGFSPADGVHLGVAISLRGGGLVVPAIANADQLDLDATMAELRGLVARSRRGALRGSELTGASMTVTNLGDRGAESVLGVIYPPQVALVGFGRVLDRPWAVDGLVGVRPTIVASLSADHRATDGHVGSLFLGSIEEFLHRTDLLEDADANHEHKPPTKESS